MHFKDIAQFTQRAAYRVHVGWSYLSRWLDQQKEIGLDLNPDFQRIHVWTKENQRRYVEFILKGGESGKDLLFNCCGWMEDFRGPFVLVDGKQRLEAVRAFLASELAIFGGYLYKDISGKLSQDHHFYVHINNLGTRTEVLQWYLDVNSGGVVHTEEELEKVRRMLKRTA